MLQVISEELYRNVLLALLCVFLTTWILLFNLAASIQVLCHDQTFLDLDIKHRCWAVWC